MSLDLESLLQQIRPHTMVCDGSLRDLADQVRAILAYDIPGNLVECGAWRGGTGFLMAGLLREHGVTNRKVWLFDSFEGIQPPQPVDGAAALAWAADKDGAHYHDNMRVGVDQVRQTAKDLGLDSNLQIVKGWFDATLLANRQRIGPIALLRIDCDWHASVRCCLEALYDQVLPGGIVVFDDYYTFDGCAAAVHEFLGRRSLSHRLEPIEAGTEDFRHWSGAVFRKGGETWRWMKQTFPTVESIAAAVPPGQKMILVDQAKLGTGSTIAGRPVVPFLEKDGVYWGTPADDQVAVTQLERLRGEGAAFLVFAQPAFWWLDHYAGFLRHLRSRYRPLPPSDDYVAFDLRAPAGAEAAA
jgi:hypothetical protein